MEKIYACLLTGERSTCLGKYKAKSKDEEQSKVDALFYRFHFERCSLHLTLLKCSNLYNLKSICQMSNDDEILK